MQTDNQTLDTVVVARINGVDILASQVEIGLVPIRPICQLFGIAPNEQIVAIKENPLFNSVSKLCLSTGSDGKQYEMFCLQFEYCVAWLLGINSSNVKEEIRGILLDYQRECVDVFRRHFIGNKRRQAEINMMEINSLEIINKLTENKIRINSELKDEQNRLQKIRSERLNFQPDLFD